jgi:PAS domain S-box-containing protein
VGTNNLENLYNLLPEPVVLTNRTGHVTAMNAAARTRLGIGASSDVSGIRVHDLVEDDAETIDRLLRQFARSNRLSFGSVRCKSLDKHEELAPCRCEGGTLPGVSAPDGGPMLLLRVLTRETTTRRFLALNEKIGALNRENRERQRVEQALQAQSRWLETTLTSIGDAVVATDGEGRVTFINRVAEELSGWHREDALGRDVEEVLEIRDQETWNVVGTPVQEVLRERTLAPMHNSAVLVGKHGLQIPIDDSAAPILNTERELLGVVLVFRDISERKRSQEALRLSEERFRMMADTAPVMMWLSDESGAVNFVNRSWLVFSGRDAKDLSGWKWLELVGEEARQEVQSAYGRALERREMFSLECPLRRADGEYRWVLLNGAPRHAESGRFVGMTGTCTDITESKNIERQLRTMLEEKQALIESNQELQQFAYAASHDLREPLRTIAAYSQLLHRRFRDRAGPEAEEYVSFIVSGVHRMQDLIEGLLEYGRVLHSGASMKTVHSEEALRGAISNLKHLIEERNAIVTHDALPEVHGDVVQLRTVFQNLISNGIQYSDAEQPCVHVSAAPAGLDSLWEFAVRDNGIGIPPEHHERVFGLFRRLAPDRPGGTGVGLAIAKRVIERHGGRIWVESEEGEGACFRFTLPAPRGKNGGSNASRFGGDGSQG